MDIYEILKVTSEGEYVAGIRHTVEDAIKCAKMVVANADMASAADQHISKHGVENGLFYAKIRLMQQQYAIAAEIWKTDIYHEQPSAI